MVAARLAARGSEPAKVGEADRAKPSEDTVRASFQLAGGPVVQAPTGARSEAQPSEDTVNPGLAQCQVVCSAVHDFTGSSGSCSS
jgi:hypothetical protein